MPNFHQYDLNATVLQAIKELGFETPTPVQRKVLPLIIENTHDLVVLAQTGTGKTAAYGLPLIQLCNSKSPATQTLVLCPTRELCVQIAKDLGAFAKYTPDLRALAVYGGSSIDMQIKAIKQGAQIIVATPGRLNDLIRRKAVKLSTVKQLVLDEADEMLNMGFQDELESILEETPKGVRKLLFSATMSNEVASMSRRYMNTPEEIIVGQRNSGAENVSHECYVVHAKDRYETLKRILDFHRDVYGIVFCRTRMETQAVADGLMADGYSADALHGDLSQEQRDRVMRKFRARDLQILVATDVAARGLDVNDLTHVINFNLPDEAEAYTHRSGRTGRAGKEGVSVVICNMRDEARIRTLERIVKKTFTIRQVPTGKAVCESQLMGLLERLKTVDVKNKEFDSFLPAIKMALKDIPAEEVVRRFLILEFNRFLEYYKDAPDLNQGRERRPVRKHEGEMSVLEINVGQRNKLTPATLISVVNRATQGAKIPLGRIKIMESTTRFEVPSDDAKELASNLNKSNFGGRKCSVKLLDKVTLKPVPT